MKHEVNNIPTVSHIKLFAAMFKPSSLGIPIPIFKSGSFQGPTCLSIGDNLSNSGDQSVSEVPGGTFAKIINVAYYRSLMLSIKVWLGHAP